jgi:hypothetical protein
MALLINGKLIMQLQVETVCNSYILYDISGHFAMGCFECEFAHLGLKYRQNIGLAAEKSIGTPPLTLSK